MTKKTKKLLFYSLVFGFFAFIMKISTASAGSNFTGPVDALFWETVAGSVIVGGLVFVLGLYFLIKYNENKNVKRDKPVNEAKFEKLWLSFAILLVVILVVISTPVLYSIEYPAQTSNPIVLNITAQQWAWSVNDTGVNLTQYNLASPQQEVNVWVGTLYELNITSRDVDHSFFVYDLAIKVDAIPGQYNTRFFKIDSVGKYVVTCAEYCGVNHYAMQFTINAMPRTQPIFNPNTNQTFVPSNATVNAG